MPRRRLNYPIEAIEGIGNVYSKKLKEIGIKTVDDLLRAGAKKSDRRRLAKALGVSEKRVLEWVNRADLFRIPGVGEEYSDLLEQAGVDTVVELARRNPENLYEDLVKVNEKKKLVRRLPTKKQVASWVLAAKKLKRIVEY
ncbi:MAG: DUF4332 domain-containing protein [Candidatus Korarchaeota archaeon]|nr:DUF4332 domain-containing protein [Candidatus Korarchaeota archaeon]